MKLESVRSPRRCAALAGVVCACSLAPSASAGGGPENALLLIDPSDPASLHLGNYYRSARDIPATNVLYMAPGAANFQTAFAANLAGLSGTIANRRLTDHIDYIVIAPTLAFFIDAPGLVTDACFPVSRFSISSAYTMAFIRDEVRLGVPNSLTNRYYAAASTPTAFDSQTAYFSGSPSGMSTARRYYISSLLGFTNPGANTPAELIAMVDRSVAADGTRPPGTFCFMNNTADPDRNVRASMYTSIVGTINSLGLPQSAVTINGVLPINRPNCAGIMTGVADFNFATTNSTISPGAFCDHLTSWGAAFDIGAQTKISAWIAAGASGSAGTVEEPCNYPTKFPHPRLHAFYVQGMSLGESYLRSAAWVPFQGLLYGDPLTRAYAHIPSVTVPGAPPADSVVSGVVTLAPQATTTRPATSIASFELLVDGVLTSSVGPAGVFSLDTNRLCDGWHDLRVLAYDNSFSKTVGRWVSSIVVNNAGRTASLSAVPAAGDLTQLFTFSVAAADPAGSPVTGINLLCNGRVVAATSMATDALNVYGRSLGSGPVELQTEARFASGARALSSPITINVSTAAGTPVAGVPHAFSYTKRVRRDQPFVVELPATSDESLAAMSYNIVTAPAQATIAATSPGPFRILTPNAGASGSDTLTFTANAFTQGSNVATVTIVYSCPGDFNGDGVVSVQDLFNFLSAWFAGDLTADFNLSGALSVQDVFDFLSAWFAVCI